MPDAPGADLGALVDEYRGYLGAVSAEAKEQLGRLVRGEGFLELLAEDRQAAMRQATEWVQSFNGVYGPMCAELATEFFEEAQRFETGLVTMAADVAAPKADRALAASVRWAFETGDPEDAETLARKLEGVLGRDVLAPARETILDSSLRYGLRYARVPSGPRVCEFCLMLASRGFVYASAETAGQFARFHDHCTCTVVPGFGEHTRVAGYDPDELYAQWRRIQRGSVRETAETAHPVDTFDGLRDLVPTEQDREMIARVWELARADGNEHAVYVANGEVRTSSSHGRTHAAPSDETERWLMEQAENSVDMYHVHFSGSPPSKEDLLANVCSPQVRSFTVSGENGNTYKLEFDTGFRPESAKELSDTIEQIANDIGNIYRGSVTTGETTTQQLDIIYRRELVYRLANTYEWSYTGCLLQP